MPKKILLIENDSAFAGTITGALESVGFEARATGDGNEGLSLAREWSPDAIVLCVEMSGVSGYLVCQKLKKDETLKTIPLVLTSAEATEETFEKHRTLKARADEYMLKPYEPAALVDKLAALVGLPEGANANADDHEEELVSLEEEIGLEAADGEHDSDLPGLDLQSMPDEPSAAPRGDDDDLRLLDDAFDGLSSSRAPTREIRAVDLDLPSEKPVLSDDVDAAAASLPEEDEGAARTDLGSLGDEAERALGALGSADESLAPPLAEPEPSARPLRGANADLLRAAGIRLLEEETDLAAPDADATRERSLAGIAPAPEPPRHRVRDGASDDELEQLRHDNAELARRAQDAELEAEKARTQYRRVEADLEAAQDEARSASERTRDAEAEVAALRQKVAEAEDEARRRGEEAQGAANAKTETLERELDEMRTELLVAHGEAEGARGEVEKRTADLRGRLAEAEAEAAKNEERVVKAYQKIKADEKVRDKVRKALAIATQLLDEGPASETDKERRAATAIGRE